MILLIVLLLLPTCLLSLICSSCPFKLEPPHSYSCPETCEGNICYIVVNKYFNGTVIAGCLIARENDAVHNGTSVCHRKEEHTICACTSTDKCNDPRASLAAFDFTEDEILEGQQIFPQIQPTEPPVVIENESIALQSVLNQTATIENEEISLADESNEQNINMGYVQQVQLRFNSTIIPPIMDRPRNTRCSVQSIFALILFAVYMNQINV